jgi:lysyl oxidase
VPGLRTRLLLLLALLAVPVTAAAQTTAPPAGTPAPDPDNPCLDAAGYAGGGKLRCPDLEMKRPFGLYLEKAFGRRLLRAGNSIDSIGAGPVELRGVRSSRRYMRAKQHIYVKGGRDLKLRTGARLRFSYGHAQRYYWKFHNAARFELWRLDKTGKRKRLVREGAKVNYCLRDLRRSNPHLRRSPGQAVYPACNTFFSTKRVTLGTSVGWSDIYPPGYLQQYIDVTGLRGCFAYVHIADPLNHIYESNEDNNDSQVIVRLPWRGRGRRGCKGHAHGPVNNQTGPY